MSIPPPPTVPPWPAAGVRTHVSTGRSSVETSKTKLRALAGEYRGDVASPTSAHATTARVAQSRTRTRALLLLSAFRILLRAFLDVPPGMAVPESQRHRPLRAGAPPCVQEAAVWRRHLLLGGAAVFPEVDER